MSAYMQPTCSGESGRWQVDDSERFDYFPDPCGNWTVWDTHYERPVCFSGIILVGLSQSEAKSICRLLNQSIDAEGELSRLLA